MKDKIIRLLKSIGIATVWFGGVSLFVFGFVFGFTKYPKITLAVGITLCFIYAVWKIYEDTDFL